MFKHLKIRKLLSAYIDKEVSAQEKKQIEAHLKECRVCSRHLEELRKTSSAMGKWKDEGMSLDLEQKIKNDFLSDKYKGVVGMRNKTKVLVGLGSVALTAFLAFVLVGQMYIRKGMQGRFKSVGDDIGGEYYAEVDDLSTNYEPYYSAESTIKEFEFADNERNYKGGHDKDGYATRSLEKPASGTFREERSSLSKVGKTRIYGDRKNRQVAAKKKRYLGASSPQDLGYLTPKEQGSVVIIEPYLPAYGDQEKVIRNADAELEVKDVQKTYDEVVKVIKEKGGYLSGANFYEAKTGKVTARIVLRVPKGKFEETLDQIRKLGDVKRFNIQSTDVSHEYKTLATELKTIKVVYDKIVKKLQEKRTDIEGAMQLESELTPYLRRIEAIKSQLARYDNLIAMPTITVKLYATSWNVMFKENLKEIARQLIALVSGAIRVILRILPTLLGIIILGSVIYAIIIFIIKGIKKTFKKKSK